MQDKVDISVIIPMYNSEKYIEGAINSIIHQEDHGMSYEIIVVDDGSRDNSVSIVKSLKNNRLKIVELPENGGLSNARNSGMRVAAGEWLQFLDSDDTLCIDLFKKFEKSRKPGINCYIFSMISENYDYILKQVITNVIDKRAFAYFGSACNKFIKRDICLDFKKGYLHEDVCFNIDMLNQNNLKIALIDDAFYIYNRKNPESIIANFKKKEFQKMHSYIFSQIDKSDDLTKMYILEISIGLLMYMPFFMSLQIAVKTALKLYKYLPKIYMKGIRHCIKTTKILHDA